MGSKENATFCQKASVYPQQTFPELVLTRVIVGPRDCTLYHHLSHLHPSNLLEYTVDIALGTLGSYDTIQAASSIDLRT